MTKNSAAYYIVVKMLNPSCRMKRPRLHYISLQLKLKLKRYVLKRLTAYKEGNVEGVTVYDFLFIVTYLVIGVLIHLWICIL